MHRFAAALLIFMSGCGNTDGNSDAPDNHGFGFAFDAVGKEGLRLRQPGATARDADLLEAIASAQVEQCVGIDAPPPPFVIVVPRDSLQGKVIGLYMRAPPLLLVDEAWIGVAYPHEVLHYLLDVTTGDPDAAHAHPGFSKCVMNFTH